MNCELNVMENVKIQIIKRSITAKYGSDRCTLPTAVVNLSAINLRNLITVQKFYGIQHFQLLVFLVFVSWLLKNAIFKRAIKASAKEEDYRKYQHKMDASRKEEAPCGIAKVETV